MLSPETDYGELNTGAMTLAFASHARARTHAPDGFVFCGETAKPVGVEFTFVTDDIDPAHTAALAAGAREIHAPERKPFGPRVSFARCPDGSLMELSTAVGS